MTESREATLAPVRRFYEVYNTHDLSLLDGLLASEYVGEVNGQRVVGPEAARGVIGAFLAAFPDIRYEVVDTLVEGRRVVTRWRAAATHLGSFAGLAPSGRRVTMTGVTLFQVEEGHISALWNVWDVHGLLEQLRG
ncbi:hypothetical protein DAETH_41910 (plasmid) [Deinococcus aetherius]|uniref:Ester cyclase n=1 Tax=Deinococcus aetherius TaxID=200252 RepID=A0ABM8AK74_9DEIO|nr:ester cyclase [Deinococcus aetherius]BDP44222.1 hypothetical protein DAETH_41910 [Deinococcus aetherius]